MQINNLDRHLKQQRTAGERQKEGNYKLRRKIVEDN